MTHIRMIVSTSIAAVTLLAMLNAATAPTVASGPATAATWVPSEVFSKLKFLQGCWQLKDGESHLDEYWSAPAGDSMMGVFRWVKGGKTTMYELLTITANDQGVTYRMRHFNGPTLVPWVSEAEGPLTFPLGNLSETEAIFEDPSRAYPRRFIFRRQGESGLFVRFEGEKEGKLAGQEFLYSRGSCPP